MKDKLSLWLSYAKKLGKKVFKSLDDIKKAIDIYLKVLKPLGRILIQIVPPVLTFFYNELFLTILENWII